MNTVEWLLQDVNPSIKYWTLKDLLEKLENDPLVQKTRTAISEQDIIRTIFSTQDSEGFWGDPRKLWGYQNTVFQLLLLSELGFKSDSRIEKAVEFLSRFQEEDGSFSSVLRTRKSSSKDFCITGIILKILLIFGYTVSSVREALNYLVTTEDNGWSCNYYPMQKDKVIPTSCYMGGIKVLAAFARLPSPFVTAEVKDIIARNAEIYLENRIYWYRKDKHGKRAKKPSWTKFAFPLFWQSDVLDVLDVLTELHVKDERMQESLELIRSKQVEGKWILERTYPKETGILGKVGQPSKWITLRALRVLKRAGYPVTMDSGPGGI